MPDEVIARVNHLGQDQLEQIIFTNQHEFSIKDIDPEIARVAGNAIDDDNNDNNDNGAEVQADDADLPGVDMGDDNNNQLLPA